MSAGFVSFLCQPRENRAPQAPGTAVSRALLPLHALFLIQLIPLPAALLRALSPGSFAAHFLPDPLNGRFQPLSVSPSATLDAWLYVAGLQGLFLALLGLTPRSRKSLAHVLVGVLVCLAAEGFWQSRTAHPAWLYGRVPILAPIGLETATFGPYYNRNHFATAMALGAGWACGLALALIRERGAGARVLASTSAATQVVILGGCSLLLTLGAAASGSRSGTAAAIGAIGFSLARAFGGRRLLTALVAGLTILALSGAAAVERLMRLDIMASRLAPWVDMTTVWRFFPAFGSGIGTFAESYWPYQQNVQYEFWQHAHNEYLEWTIEAGLLGLFVAWTIGRALRRSVGFMDWARDAAAGAITAFAVQALLDFPNRIPANAALLVCTIALSLSPRSSDHRDRA
jgi:hypothetical protein